MLKRIILVIALILLSASLFGCNTVKGVGEDIKSAGEAGERAINK
jgi:entericidin B